MYSDAQYLEIAQWQFLPETEQAEAKEVLFHGVVKVMDYTLWLSSLSCSHAKPAVPCIKSNTLKPERMPCCDLLGLLYNP